MIGGGIPCPVCGQKLQLTIDFMIEHSSAACPRCYSVMSFPKNDKLFDEYKKIKVEMETLKNQMRKMVKLS